VDLHTEPPAADIRLVAEDTLQAEAADTLLLAVVDSLPAVADSADNYQTYCFLPVLARS
jgi:hypothetical protein